MLTLLEPSFVNQSHPIAHSNRCEDDSSLEFVSSPQKTLLTSDYRYVLLWKGYHLDVFYRKPKQLLPISSFNFAAISADKSIHISSVAELKYLAKEDTRDPKNALFVVALNRKVGGSVICLIDVWLNRLIKCIDTPFRIVTLLSLRFCESTTHHSLPLADELKAMHGVVCVGTEGGLVSFIDLCLDRVEEVDFLVPNKLKFIVKDSSNSKNLDISASRSVANVNDQHLCLPLNSESQHKGKFIYRSHDGSTLAKFQGRNVFVSSIEYIFQTNTVCVGFNFGGFQIWNATTLSLECSCSLDSDLLPVVKFSFQEPENDPKNYCYLWVVRGVEAVSGMDIQDEVNEPSAAFLYALVFSRKEWVPGLGFLYTNFEMCVIRFEYHMAMNSDPQACHSPERSCFIGCETLYQGTQCLKQFDDESVLMDSSLCAFSWEAWNEQTSQSMVYFAIFDLNQWYQCQMPSFISLSKSQHMYSSFFGLYSLTDVCNLAAPDAILNIKIIGESITTFRPRNNFSDISYYPVSLSFDVIIVSENRVFEANYLGLQKRCLSQIMTKGANVLVDPSNAISECMSVGLLSPETSTEDVTLQRETLLILALQNNYVPFIVEVIQQWSSDGLSYIGCNCKFILDWIWKNVSVIKSRLDKLTEPLFSCGQLLSEVDLETLYSYEIDLKALAVLLKNLQVLGTATTEKGLTELATRIEVTELITSYLRILLWLYGCGLLPEHVESDQSIGNEVVYPRGALEAIYESRRNNLNAINPSQINPMELLMIDGIIGQLPAISSLWQHAQGSGLYPPPTIHSLIGIYLLESLPQDLKHFVMLYFLFDIATLLTERESEVAEKVKLFPAAFHLKPGITKLVQGMWALDHKFFDFALETLCDPAVKNTLCDDKDGNNWFYSDLQERIVTSFLYQQQYRHAMQFITTSCLFTTDSPLKEKIKISILLSNHKILEAFHFQRCCRNENNTEDILLHFFLACEEMNLMDKLFKMPLDCMEEDALIYYLINISRNRNNAKHLLVLYFLFNNKIVDASNFLETCENEQFSDDEKFMDRNRQLSLIIKSYLSSLPSTFSELAVEINQIEKLKDNQRKTAVIFDGKARVVKATSTNEQAMAHSDIVRCVMEQMENVGGKTKDVNETTSVTPFRKRILDNGLLLTENSPFVRPAVTVESEPLIQRDASYVSTKKANSTIRHSFLRTPGKPGTSSYKEIFQHDSTLLSILRTPPVKRLNVSGSTSMLISETLVTPSSILKVKNLMRSSSPQHFSLLKTSKEKSAKMKLRFSIPSSQLTKENQRDEISLGSVLSQISPVKSSDTEMDAENENTTTNNFVFTPPMLSPGKKQFQKEIVTPTNMPTFVFSPPLTRSRSKQKKITASVLDQNDSFMADSVLKTPDVKSRSNRHSMQLRTSSTTKKITTDN